MKNKIQNLFIVSCLTFFGSINNSHAQNLNQNTGSINSNSNFKTCVNSATNLAIAEGANKERAIAATTGINFPNQKTIDFSKVQPEHRHNIWDYLAGLVDEERVLDGQKAFLSQEAFLRDLGIRTGVDPSVIVGIWGVETNFGKVLGRFNVIDTLATLGCTNWRRTEFFKSELVEAIKIQASGNVNPNNFIGSWAGAFGQTQFMPSSYLRLAKDGNNDGIKNIIEEPKDALESTANFLLKAGYRRGEKWGYEVLIPSNYKAPIGRTNTQTLEVWANNGVKLIDGNPLPKNELKYGLIYPAGINGPAVLVGRNFNAVYAYNPAISYSLAVNLLADRIKGGKGFITPWPTNDPGISRAQRREIQTILASKGYDIGAIDGIIGEKALAAIKDIYTKNGLSFNGIVATNCLNIIRKFK